MSDHESFNILDALTGRTYPSTTIKVHQDAEADFLIAEANVLIGELRAANEQEKARELETRINELRERAKSTAITVYLQSISDDDRDLLREAALSKYPEEFDFLQRTVPNADRDVFYTNNLWASHITALEAKGGKDTDITVDKIVALRTVLPDYSKRAIAAKLDSLYSGANDGYQQTVQDTAFSSAASPEA